MELKHYYQKGVVEVGCDEAGRGCLAGPVYAAAVILDPEKKIKGLNDSKQLNKKTRERLKEEIKKNALAWAVAHASPKEIDKINILNASFLAMHRAIKKLTLDFNLLLIDGNRFNAFEDYPHHCIIKGDSKYTCIAAASILAKTHRDQYMEKIAKKFPLYDWNNNMGYPTKKHREAIFDIGPCIHHRKKFKLLPQQLKFDLLLNDSC